MKSTKLLKDFLMALRAELISQSKSFEERMYAFKQNNRIYRTQKQAFPKGFKELQQRKEFFKKEIKRRHSRKRWQDD